MAAPRAKRLLLRSGFYGAFRRALPSRRVAILRYHAVCEPPADYAAPGICVSPGAFEAHIAYLAAHYRVLPLPEIAAALRNRRSLPRNAVAITFDDGYADNLYAARALARYGLSATFYLTAGCIGNAAPFWPSELRALIRGLRCERLELRLNGSAISFRVATAEERNGTIRSLSKIFKAHTIPVREDLRDQLRRQSAQPDVPSPMLQWDEVIAMRDMGMTLGSHTMTHPNLPNAGIDAARREIGESKTLLEERLGNKVTMFSYPNGGAERYMSAPIARIVAEAGFDAATTSRNAFAGASSDLFALERVQVKERLEELIFALEIERFAFVPAARPGEVE